MSSPSRAARASVLTGIDVVARICLQVGVTAILARLLVPEAFGQIAMLQIFLGVAALVAEGGLGTALMRHHQSSLLEESSVFYANLIASFIVMLALFAVAPWIEGFYDQPGLALVVMALSLTVLINAFGTVHRVLLIRALDVAVQMRAALLSQVLSGAVAIWLAWRGFGIWAIVVQAITAAAINAMVLWRHSSWRPGKEASWDALRPLLSFGWPLLAAGVLEASIGRAYTLLLGRVHGAATLGQYALAVSNQQLPQILLRNGFSRVFLPVASVRGEDTERVANTTRSMIQTAMFLYVPCVIGLAGIAPNLVPALFGDRWEQSIVLLQVLAIGSVVFPLNLANLTLLQAVGLTKTFLRLEILKKVVLLILVVCATSYGAVAMAAAYAVASFIAFFINAGPAKGLIGYGAWRQLRDCAGIVIAGAVMGCAVMAAGVYLHESAWFELLVQVFIGVPFFLLLCWVFSLVPAGALVIFAVLRDAMIPALKAGKND